MNAQHHVLVVTQSCSRGGDLGGWLRSEGYCVTCVSTFAAARLYLQMNPSLVITELKLGAYNGLHLAVRANSTQIPVLVLGDRDAFFEHEARQLGTTYIAFDDATRERIISYVGTQVRCVSPTSPGNLAWIGSETLSAGETPAASSTRSRSDHRLRVH